MTSDTVFPRLPLVPGLALLWLPVLAACGDRAGSASLSEHEVVPPEAIRVLGTTDDFSRIRDLARALDGTVWVLDNAPPFFTAFGPEGEVVAAFGERGEGPGEYQNPVALAVLPSGSAAGSVWVYDRGRHAMLRIDEGPEGAQRAVPFPREEVAPGRLLSVDDGGLGASRVWLRGVDEGFLVARGPDDGFGMARSLWGAELVALSPEDGAVSAIVAPAEHLGDPEARYPGAMILLPFPLWDRCSDGRVVLYDPATNRLVRLERNGSTGPSVALPPERGERLTGDRLFRIMVPRITQEVPAHERPPDAELRRSFDAEFGEARALFADVFPEYVALHCAEDGGVWLQPFDAEEGALGHGPEWWRVEGWDAGGGDARIGRVRLPAAFTPFRFEEGGAWGVVFDDLDLPSVAWVEMP
jgi:hypothetical protein